MPHSLIARSLVLLDPLPKFLRSTLDGSTRSLYNLLLTVSGNSWPQLHYPKLPTQLLTQEKIAAALLDSDGYYVGVKDFREQYEKLWKIN